MDKKPKNSKVIVKSKVVKNIEVDWNDEYNTSPNTGILVSPFKNFLKISDSFIRKIFKSTSFWLLCLIFPMLFSFVYMYFYINFDGLIDTSGIASGMLTWMMITPLIVMSFIVFPSFISSSKESSLFKRLIMVGLTKKQIFYQYMAFTVLFSISILLFLNGIWSFASMGIVNSIQNSANSASIMNSPFEMFDSMNIIMFMVLLVLSILSFNSMGYFFGMKTNNPRKAMGLGFGFYVFVTMASGFSSLLQIDVSKINASNDFGTNLFVQILIGAVQWLFIITPASLMSVSLNIAAGLLQTSQNPPNFEIFLSKDTFDLIKKLIIAFSIFVSLASWLYIWFNESKITTLEQAR